MNWRLNRAVGSILVLLFLVGVLPTTGSGATNQGLEWGVDVGNRFDYHVQDNNTGFDCYIIIESLPAILDGVSRIIHPTIFNVTPDMKLYFANGSVAGWWEWPLTQVDCSYWELESVVRFAGNIHRRPSFCLQFYQHYRNSYIMDVDCQFLL